VETPLLGEFGCNVGDAAKRLEFALAAKAGPDDKGSAE
jgi:hypothetical protein